MSLGLYTLRAEELSPLLGILLSVLLLIGGGSVYQMK